MERTWKADYEKFARTARENVAATLDNMDYPALERAAELILAAKAAGKRLHISGIGKPAHLAGYAASLFSSTGTPAYFLHGTEAVHGSCGQLVPGDVVIFISNSGETAEMKATVSAVKNNGCAVIGVSGNASSWLAQQSEVHLLAHADAEGGPLDRAPRASILAETLVLQALSVLLQSEAKACRSFRRGRSGRGACPCTVGISCCAALRPRLPAFSRACRTVRRCVSSIPMTTGPSWIMTACSAGRKASICGRFRDIATKSPPCPKIRQLFRCA